MKTFLRFVSAIFLFAFLTISHAFGQAEQESKNSVNQELPFRLSIAQKETADGQAIQLMFSNESDSTVAIDQKALRLATPSILIDEKNGGADRTKLTRFTSSQTYSGHPLTREQILNDSSRVITVKPHEFFEISLPMREVIQYAQKRSPDQVITVRFFITKLILAGKFSKLKDEDLYTLNFSSNSLLIK
jgi:hypothetical protein